MLLSFLGFSQTQAAKVELSISPMNVEAGESFNITITANVQGDVDIENLPSTFVQDYSIQQGQYPEMDHNTGSLITTYFVSYSGMISKAGDYEIGPAFVKNGNKVYKSNKVKIKVGGKVAMTPGQVTASQLNDPAFGLIEANKKVIYEGEPVLLAAKIYSYYDPSNIGGYQSYDVNSAVIKHPIGNSNNIKVTPELLKGKKLYAFSYDKNVIFPDGVGKFRIDPFKLKLYQGYKSFPITSNSLDLEIKPLPANPPANFIGAVGDFRIERTIDSSKIKQGDVVKMDVVISGIGNLQNILEPKLNLPAGFIIYGDPVITENFTIGIHGAEGEVIYQYNMQITKSGDFTLPATTITYFDPNKKQYIEASSESSDLEIEVNSKYIVSATSEENEVIADEAPKRDLTHRATSDIVSNDSIYGTAIFWSGISIPVLSALFFIFFLKRREKSADVIAHRQSIKEKVAYLHELIGQTKIYAANGDQDKYYAGIESIIKKAFEIKLNIDQERVLNKSEILGYLDQNNLTVIKTKVVNVLSICEQSRYGIQPSSDSNDQILSEVEEIINQLDV